MLKTRAGEIIGNVPMRLIKRPEVTAKTGKSRSAIYAAIAAGTFPAPVETGPNSVAWVEKEIDAWIGERIAARDLKSFDKALEEGAR
jgi:prophage regulatory protein